MKVFKIIFTIFIVSIFIFVFGCGDTTEYNIYYDNLDNATCDNPISYNKKTETFKLKAPIHNNFKFLGWTYEGQEEPIKNVKIEKGSTGDKIFKANWLVLDLKKVDNEYQVIGLLDKSVEEVVIIEQFDGIKITSIGVNAFSDCTNLTNITLSNNITSIGSDAFSGCTSLIYNEYNGGTYLGNKDNPYIALIECDKTLKTYNINSATKVIGAHAFSYCEELTNIEIPDSVINIGNGAFLRCISLTNIKIPENIKSIGYYAFCFCTSLTGITIPEGIESLETGIFAGCTSLENVEIPSSVKRIGSSAFEKCASLEEIELPTNVTSIGDEAFRECASLVSIEIPEGVTSIGNSAFNGCTSLTSIEIPQSVTSICNEAFRECTSLTSIEIPESVTRIGFNAFRECISLTSIIIPKGVTDIGISAFGECTSLTIYCETESKPYTWNDNWNISNCPVVWSYKE